MSNFGKLSKIDGKCLSSESKLDEWMIWIITNQYSTIIFYYSSFKKNGAISSVSNSFKSLEPLKLERCVRRVAILIKIGSNHCFHWIFQLVKYIYSYNLFNTQFNASINLCLFKIKREEKEKKIIITSILKWMTVQKINFKP